MTEARQKPLQLGLFTMLFWQLISLLDDSLQLHLLQKLVFKLPDIIPRVKTVSTQQSLLVRDPKLKASCGINLPAKQSSFFVSFPLGFEAVSVSLFFVSSSDYQGTWRRVVIEVIKSL